MAAVNNMLFVEVVPVMFLTIVLDASSMDLFYFFGCHELFLAERRLLFFKAQLRYPLSLHVFATDIGLLYHQINPHHRDTHCHHRHEFNHLVSVVYYYICYRNNLGWLLM